VLQPYVGAGLSRIIFSAEVPKYFVFKDWYSGYSGIWKDEDARRSWGVFIPEEFEIRFQEDNPNKPR